MPLALAFVFALAFVAAPGLAAALAFFGTVVTAGFRSGLEAVLDFRLVLMGGGSG